MAFLLIDKICPIQYFINSGSEIKRQKDPGNKEIAWTKVNIRYLNLFQLCQFLLIFYLVFWSNSQATHFYTLFYISTKATKYLLMLVNVAKKDRNSNENKTVKILFKFNQYFIQVLARLLDNSRLS